MPSDTEPDAVRFVVLGDSGTGDAAQYQVALAIARVCHERGCDFLVHTGDILYESGADSVDDPQFRSKFETPYGGLGLPVYLVLGNHDAGGDPQTAEDLARWKPVGDLEVAYGERTDLPSSAWHMPARWYAFQRGPVAFAAFDTSAFVFAGLEADPDGELHQAEQTQSVFAATAWPSNATWRFAVGHHPYISNGMHGDAGQYGNEPGDPGSPQDGSALKTFYQDHVCGTADVLLTGHDHDLEWLSPTVSCGATRFLVSGAAARPRELADPSRHDAAFQRGGSLGFWWLEARGNTLRVVAFDGDADRLYEGTVLKPGPTASASASPSWSGSGT